MALTRRQFLKWAGATGIGAVVFNGCRVPDAEIQVQSSVELPEDLVTGRDNYYATVAQTAGSSEGLLVRVMEGRAKKVEGNPLYPMNAGKHHVRSEALLQAAYHPDRITEPLVRVAKGGPWRKISWPEAMTRLADTLSGADPASVLVATGPVRGQLAEVVHRFTRAYGSEVLGLDTVDQIVLREAISRVYRQRVLPDFDIAHSTHVLSFGADFLGTWLDPTHFSRGYGEFRHGHGHRGHLVHVDTRFSVTAAAADQWVYVSPGTEGVLALSIASVIIKEDLAKDKSAVRALTGGNPRALRAFEPERVAGQLGLDVKVIEKIARDFSSAERPLAIGGGSAGAHTNGLFNLSAVYALNYLVKAVNRPGGVIFNPDPDASHIAGASIRKWSAAVNAMQSGQIKVLLVRDANIEYGLPKGLNARAAIGQVETVVSFSSFLDETTADADLILPGTTPLEEWGTDVPDPGPGYATIGFQQPVINRYREALSFGDVLIATANTLGLEIGSSNGKPWSTMRESVQGVARRLHQSKSGSVVAPSFAEFWKQSLEQGGWFDTNQLASATPPTPQVLPTGIQRAELAGNETDFPFFLVPFESQGVLAGQFSHLPWAQSVPDPITTVAWQTWVELNPRKAAELGLEHDDLVIVDSPTGSSIRASVYVNPATPTNVAAIPFGQGHRHSTSFAARRGANVLDLIVPAQDEETGAFAWAGTRVRITKTNRRKELPKLEGIVLAVQLPGEPILEVQRSKDGAHSHSNGH